MALLTIGIIGTHPWVPMWAAREVSDWAHASAEIPRVLTGYMEKGEMYRIMDAWSRLEGKHSARLWLPVVCEVDIPNVYGQHSQFSVDVECRITLVPDEFYGVTDSQ